MNKCTFIYNLDEGGSYTPVKIAFCTTENNLNKKCCFQVLGGKAHQDGVLWFSWMAGIVRGSMIGARQVLEGHAKRGQHNVVIIGRYVPGFFIKGSL
jgi:hypothetical protein